MGRSMRKLAKFGVNIEEALERFMGDENAFLECIDLLLEDKKFYDLGDSIKKDEYGKSYNIALSLKGAIGNLSIEPLNEKISNIVGPLSIYDYADLEKHYTDMMKTYESMKKIR